MPSREICSRAELRYKSLMSAVEVSLDFTPNPDSLKYSTNQQILAKGALNFAEASEAEGKSKLAENLFKIKEVKSVMLGTNFVTVHLSSQEELQDLNDQLSNCIRSYLESGDPIVEAGAVKSADTSKTLTPEEQKITEILENEIRPAVAMDGGDIALEKYEDGVVFLKMQGSCAGCPSSLMTLKMGVETRLKEALPEIQEVIPV